MSGRFAADTGGGSGSAAQSRASEVFTAGWRCWKLAIFSPGDSVRTRAATPTPNTRLPRPRGVRASATAAAAQSTVQSTTATPPLRWSPEVSFRKVA